MSLIIYIRVHLCLSTDLTVKLFHCFTFPQKKTGGYPLFQNVDKLHIYQRYAGSDNFIMNELNGFRN
jgi:hypothetical protein